MSKIQENNASQKDPLYFKRKWGLQTLAKTKNILPEDRLFVVENLKKAARIQNIFPEATVVSSGGIPFDIKLKIPRTGEENIEFSIAIENDKGKNLIRTLQEKAKHASVIFLTTDTSSRGEAIAQGLYNELPEHQHKIHRLLLKSLEREYVQKSVSLEESLETPTQCKKNKASSYWIQAVMDITWRNKVSPWLDEAAKAIKTIWGPTEKNRTPHSISRIQCSILHLLSNHEATHSNYRGYKYWEVHALLSGSLPGTILQAHICVPNLLLLQEESQKITHRIWEEKLQKNLLAAREGKGVPQKEPGSAWRFDTEVEASLYKHHLKRYPLMTILHLETREEEIEAKGAHSTESLLETGIRKQWAKQKEMSETLEDLFLGGLISHPKTSSENLSEQTFQNMWVEAAKRGETLLHTKRTFPKNPQNQEAIHPTKWEKTPEAAKQEILRCVKPPKAQLALQLYKEIYERAWQSQTPNKKTKRVQVTTTGPLHVTVEEAFTGKPIGKENVFKALMNLCMSGKVYEQGETPLTKLKKDSVMQAIKIHIVEKETEYPKQMNREWLLLTLQKANLGKLETLCTLLPKLEEDGLIQTNENEDVSLTKTGKIIINLLNEYLGGFIHQKYHEVVENQLKEIEAGRTQPQSFLQYWWKTLCEVTNILPPIPEAVADSSGKNLKEIEKKLREEKTHHSKEEIKKFA